MKALNGEVQLFVDLAEALRFDFYLYAVFDAECSNGIVRECFGLSDEQLAELDRGDRFAAFCREARRSPLLLGGGEVGRCHSGFADLLARVGAKALGVFASDVSDGATGIHVFGKADGETSTFDARTVRVISAICDSSSRRTAEIERRTSQFRRLVLQLSESENRERRRVAELLHDDLQQTLAGAKVHVDMARRHAAEDGYLQERLGTAAELLRDVISRSRTLSHELQPTILSRQGIGPALRSLADQMQKTHGLTVDIRCADSVPALSETVKTFVYRAVQELLFNVVKHADVDRAQLATGLDGETFIVEVRDHGKGFDIRTDAIDESSGGIGLVSLRERLEAVGGTVDVESAPGEGSLFTIRVPTRREPSHIAEPVRGVWRQPSPPGHTATEAKITILLVDDHAVIRQGLAMLLNEESDLMVVGEADGGGAAIEAVRRLHPAVVVMDYTMPDMDGDEATRAIKREFPEVRVVGLSMHAETDAPERMLEAGADVYLPKTGPSENVINAIRQLVS